MKYVFYMEILDFKTIVLSGKSKTTIICIVHIMKLTYSKFTLYIFV